MHAPDAAPCAANACEIYSVPHKNSFVWKWRYTGVDGGINVCPQEYERFFECVAAARAGGYEPRPNWTGPCALIVTRERRSRKDGAK